MIEQQFGCAIDRRTCSHARFRKCSRGIKQLSHVAWRFAGVDRSVAQSGQQITYLIDQPMTDLTELLGSHFNRSRALAE
jgi:hypothetical protein